MSGEAVAIGVKAPKDQILTYRITPLPGRLMSAESVGGQIVALAELLVSLADKDDDLKWSVFIPRIETHADGVLEFELLIAPFIKDEP